MNVDARKAMGVPAIVAAGLAGKVSVQLSLPEEQKFYRCEDRIRRGIDTFKDVGQALMEIREGRLYRAEFKTFEDYCQKRWGWTSRRAGQICAASEVVRNLVAAGPAWSTEDSPQETAPLPPYDLVPQTESQARPLAALEPKEQAEAWGQAVQDAGGQPTAKQVAAVVESRKWPKPNEHGVYGSKEAQVIKFTHYTVVAEIVTLQIGKDRWVFSSMYQYVVGTQTGHSGPLTAQRTFPNRWAALKVACEQLIEDHAQIARRKEFAVQRTAARKVLVWAQGILAEAKEALQVLKPNGEQKAKAQPIEFRLEAETPAPASKPEERILKQVHKLLDELQQLWCLVDADRTATRNIDNARSAMLNMKEHFEDRLRQNSRAAEKPKPNAAAKRERAAEAEKTDPSCGRYLVCREPMKGSITNKVRRYSTIGGWTNDPAKAKKFSIREATERASYFGDVVIPRAEALRQFKLRH